MGDKDTVTKNYTKDNRVFADIVNLALYGGENVVHPGDIRELDTAQLHVLFSTDPKDKRPETVQKYRDVLKEVTIHGETFIARIIAGVENQSVTHYAMPVRSMLYDALNYAEQVVQKTKSHRQHGEKMDAREFLSGLKKEDRLIPVKTIVVSYDAGQWDGALTLHEMLDWNGIPDDIKNRIPDYEVTLIQPGDLEDEVLHKLPSSFGNTMGFIKYSRDAEKLKKFVSENEGFQHFPLDALAVLNAFCNLEELNIEEYKEGGECDMCQALTDIMKREMEKGVAEGLAEGKAEGIAEGKLTILANLVVNGIIPFDVALSESGLSKEEFIAEAASFNIVINL